MNLFSSGQKWNTRDLVVVVVVVVIVGGGGGCVVSVFFNSLIHATVSLINSIFCCFSDSNETKKEKRGRNYGRFDKVTTSVVY